MAPSLKSAFTLLKVWKLAVWNGLVSALVVVGQEVFTNYAFRCPCVHGLNVAIVVVVFVVPAAVLLCFGFLLQPDTWKAVTGCCAIGDAARVSGAEVAAPKVVQVEHPQPAVTGGDETNAGAGEATDKSCHCSQRCFWPMLAKALIAPIVWVSVALLTGDYVACAYSGYTWAGKDLLSEELNVQEVLARIPCTDIQLHANISEDEAKPIREKVNNWLHTLSQFYGFGLIAGSILVGTAFVCYCRCRYYKSLKEKQFRDQYRQEERKVFREQAKEFIKEHAKRDAQTFFEKKCSDKGSIINLESFHKTWADFSKPGEYSDNKHFSWLQAYAKSIRPPAQQQPESPQLLPQQL